MHQGLSAAVNTARTGVAAKSDATTPIAIFGGVAAYLGFIGLIVFLSMRWARRRRKAADQAMVQALTASGAQPLHTGPDGGYYQGTLREFELAGQRFLVRSGDCRVFVSSWTATSAVVQLPVPCQRLGELPEGTALPIRTHTGALGLTWVEPLQ